MDVEIVDIVDKNNKVLFQATKTKAHKEGFLHQTVISEVIDSQGNWLLVKQSSSRQDPGQYVSPVGGHVRAGESLEKALKREAKEELGLSDFKFKYKGKCIFNRPVKKHLENHYFLVYEIYSDGKPILNEESESYRKFTVKELKKLLKSSPRLFGDAFHMVVENIFPYLKSTS